MLPGLQYSVLGEDGSALKCSKGKALPSTGYEGPEGEWSYNCTLSLTSALGGRLVVNATLRPLYPQEIDPEIIVQGAGWVPGPFWKSLKNFVFTSTRSLDRSARGMEVCYSKKQKSM
jgi:hypothetical protein